MSSRKDFRVGIGGAIACAGVLALLSAPGVYAQGAAVNTQATQVLDRVEVFNSNNVLRVTSFETAPNALALRVSKTTTQGFGSCQYNPARGLFCLDGMAVRNWPAPQTVPPPAGQLPTEVANALFSCQNTNLQLDTPRRGLPCTSMTVDLAGNIFLAARESNSTHSLIKVAREDKNGVCTDGMTKRLAAESGYPEAQKYCFAKLYTGRPLLLDISPVDGELAAKFPYGKGIVGVELRRTVVFYPTNFKASDAIYPEVQVLGSGKTDWSLGNESIQSASILQREVEPGIVDNYTLITTSLGKILRRDVLNPASATLWFDATTRRPRSTTGTLLPACAPTLDDQFDLRVSPTSGRVFVTDRKYCLATALAPLPTSGPITGLGDPRTVTTAAVLPSGSTSTTSTAVNVPPDGASVSPGISINLADCFDLNDGCTLIPDTVEGEANSFKGARMYAVKLGTTSTGMVLFQVKNIPDCRYLAPVYLPGTTPPTLDVAHPCNQPGVIVPAPNDPYAAYPQRQYLNVTPLLPKEITDLFDPASSTPPNGLPAMYIQPRYRAQAGADNSYEFEALFGITEAGVRFIDNFTVELDISDPNLLGTRSLGCGLQATTLYPSGKAFNQLDIVTMVSEKFTSVATGLAPASAPASMYVDMLLNKGCFNPTSSAGTRWSMYSYGLVLAEDVPVLVPAENTTPATVKFQYNTPKKYLELLVSSLFADLKTAQESFACQNVDKDYSTSPISSPLNKPLSDATCATLTDRYNNALGKLNDCIAATQDPKTSQGDQNCQAFSSQLDNYVSLVKTAPAFGIDPANRKGELVSRADVIKYMFEQQFLEAVRQSTLQ